MNAYLDALDFIEEKVITIYFLIPFMDLSTHHEMRIMKP